MKALFRELGEATDTILMLSNPPNKGRDISGEDECSRCIKRKKKKGMASQIAASGNVCSVTLFFEVNRFPVRGWA